MTAATADRRLRTRCETVLRDLDVPVPWDLSAFLDRLGARRGRPIIAEAAPALERAGLTAQWWKMPDADVVLHAPTASVFALELNIFHEVGHMLCGHDRGFAATVVGADLEALASAPALRGAAGAAATILSRGSRFDRAEEREAEYVAYRIKLLAERAAARAPLADPGVDALRSTMRRTLGAS